MSTTRTYDLAAYQGVPTPGGGEARLRPALAEPGNAGRILTGIQKLAERVLRLLLTEVGSVRHKPAAGTPFMLDARLGSWQTVADVTTSFRASEITLRRQLVAVETDAMPDDERYASLTLEGVTVGPGTASVRLRLLSAAGTAYTFVAPLGA